MKPKGLLIAIVLLAALGGLIWWSNKKQAAKPAADTSSVKILSIPDDQFQEIHIKTLHGCRSSACAATTESGPSRSPSRLPADQDAVSSLVSALSSLNADKKLEDNATDLHQYGLDVPTLDVTIARKDGKKDELLIGDSTLDNAGAYAKLVQRSAHLHRLQLHQDQNRQALRRFPR